MSGTQIHPLLFFLPLFTKKLVFWASGQTNHCLSRQCGSATGNLSQAMGMLED